MSTLPTLPALHDRSALHTHGLFVPFTLFLSWNITSSESNEAMSKLTHIDHPITPGVYEYQQRPISRDPYPIDTIRPDSKTITMAIEIQFDPFNFALSTMLVILMVAELHFTRRERRRLQGGKATPESG
jgi:hypothetical protein